ncbi:NUDIX hydrolase [Planktotalea sp.]|uniref:NUDIX hydrolase n=1 Tax=Planktotalea sp. TaxID=2029877 RepID=UPI003F6A80BC
MLSFCEDQLLTYLRDDVANIPYPALWDLLGVGAEGDETPVECALRETKEEFALTLPLSRIIWSRAYPSMLIEDTINWFFVAPITAKEIESIELGEEGQQWRMMPITTYLDRPEAIPHLKAQIRDFLSKKI